MNKPLILVLLACITTAANAQLDMTHIKTHEYDAYAVKSVNATDSTFSMKIALSLDGGNLSSAETFKVFFSQVDSTMYRLYGDQYDSKQRKALHKKLAKDFTIQDREADRKTKKIQRKLKKELKKEVRKLSRQQ